VSWLGVAYLTWIGTRALLNATSTVHSLSVTLQSRCSLAQQEFLVAITNPKALLRFAVILPRFISNGHQGIGQLLFAGFAYLRIPQIRSSSHPGRRRRQPVRGRVCGSPVRLTRAG
jgi:homoserine/homoserine lactone efflux protein